MTAEPTYEYRVVDGRGWALKMRHEADARECAPRWDREDPGAAPHRIQRRLVTSWEDVPDDQ